MRLLVSNPDSLLKSLASSPESFDLKRSNCRGGCGPGRPADNMFSRPDASRLKGAEPPTSSLSPVGTPAASFASSAEAGEVGEIGPASLFADAGDLWRVSAPLLEPRWTEGHVMPPLAPEPQIRLSNFSEKLSPAGDSVLGTAHLPQLGVLRPPDRIGAKSGDRGVTSSTLRQGSGSSPSISALRFFCMALKSMEAAGGEEPEFVEALVEASSREALDFEPLDFSLKLRSNLACDLSDLGETPSDSSLSLLPVTLLIIICATSFGEPSFLSLPNGEDGRSGRPNTTFEGDAWLRVIGAGLPNRDAELGRDRRLGSSWPMRSAAATSTSRESDSLLWLLN